jgi:hypothetical protein
MSTITDILGIPIGTVRSALTRRARDSGCVDKS